MDRIGSLRLDRSDRVLMCSIQKCAKTSHYAVLYATAITQCFEPFKLRKASPIGCLKCHLGAADPFQRWYPFETMVKDVCVTIPTPLIYFIIYICVAYKTAIWSVAQLICMLHLRSDRSEPSTPLGSLGIYRAIRALREPDRSDPIQSDQYLLIESPIRSWPWIGSRASWIAWIGSDRIIPNPVWEIYYVVLYQLYFLMISIDWHITQM